MAAPRVERSLRLPSLVTLKVASATDAEHPARLAALALRSRSPPVLGALAEGAGAGPAGLARARGVLHAGTVPDAMLTRATGPYAVALATALAGLQPAGPDARLALVLATALIRAERPQWWWPRASTVAVQNAVLCGEPDLARSWLGQLTGIPRPVQFGTEADVANPYLPRGGARPVREQVSTTAHAAWEEAFSVPFARGTLAPLRVDPSATELFDGLGAAAHPGSIDGPPVTVVMPTYAPDEGLTTAVRSLLAQSYGNLEILLVDDCSGAQFTDRYEQAAALDQRITLLRMPVNGGSYLGRNAAMAQATGTFITFQDGDDWSHPERIAQQVAVLMEEPERPASLSRAIRATDDLVCTWLGFSPQRDNASSLMLTRAALERLGPFQQVRKGADSEYHKRLEAVLGPPVFVKKPLAVTRLRGGSLSRADFTLDWHTPDRVNYRNVFGHWHRTRAAAQTPLVVGPDAPQPFPPPRSFLRGLPGAAPRPTHFPVGYLLDASVAGPLPGTGVPAATQERLGQPVVLHRENFGLARARWEPFTAELLELVQTGVVDLVSSTDQVHIETLIVLTPGSLELTDDTGLACTADRVIVPVPLPDQQGEVNDLAALSQSCREVFGQEPQWAALDQDTQQEWARDGWALPLLAELLEAELLEAEPARAPEGSADAAASVRNLRP